ncbi:MAG: SxtJ family membrane protein [Thermoanaerobaculia bacterium]
MKRPFRRSRPHRAEREFGLLIGAILILFGGIWTYRGRFGSWAIAVLTAGCLLLLLGMVRPEWLALPRRGWMRLAELLGGVVTAVVLALVYFLVLTPIGLFKRATGWDPLGRRAAAARSYWRPYAARPADPRHFEKMF